MNIFIYGLKLLCGTWPFDFVKQIKLGVWNGFYLWINLYSFFFIDFSHMESSSEGELMTSEDDESTNLDSQVKKTKRKKQTVDIKTEEEKAMPSSAATNEEKGGLLTDDDDDDDD